MSAQRQAGHGLPLTKFYIGLGALALAALEGAMLGDRKRMESCKVRGLE